MMWTLFLVAGGLNLVHGLKIAIGDPEIVLQSDGYPRTIPEFTFQEWDLRAVSPNSRIALKCEDIRLPEDNPCTSTMLWIHDGDQVTRICHSTGEWSRQSTGDRMRVRLCTGGIPEARLKEESGVWPEQSPDQPVSTMPGESSSRTRETQVNMALPIPVLLLLVLVAGPTRYVHLARIVGGKETKVNEYPLMAGVIHSDTGFLFCGGSIITHRHVLTAAHCTLPNKQRQLSVLLGEHDISTNNESKFTQKIQVDHSIEHEEYNEFNFHNDIALLVLKSSIQYNQFVGPVCLPSGPTRADNEFVKVLGWGRLANQGPTSQVLMQVSLRVVPVTVCAGRHGGYEIFTQQPRQICTFGRNKDSCQGDSGGPLIWLDPATNRFTQVALVSFGKKCGSQDPAVNTDVSFYLDWIHRHVKATYPQEKTCLKQ